MKSTARTVHVRLLEAGLKPHKTRKESFINEKLKNQAAVCKRSILLFMHAHLKLWLANFFFFCGCITKCWVKTHVECHPAYSQRPVFCYRNLYGSAYCIPLMLNKCKVVSSCEGFQVCQVLFIFESFLFLIVSVDLRVRCVSKCVASEDLGCKLMLSHYLKRSVGTEIRLHMNLVTD